MQPKLAESIAEFVARRNEEKQLFTPGPAALVAENIYGLMPCFGRGDSGYEEVENRVLGALKELTGHDQIARLQGSGSSALEVMISNFCFGRVLVVDSGFYSARVYQMVTEASERYGQISEFDTVHWTNLEDAAGRYDWLVGCFTETSIGLKQDIYGLHQTARRLGARLMLDATASIGLEDGHELADAISYSSCKGLFGLTGAGFIAFNETPTFCVSSFSLSLENHLNKKMTGPYHAICSLDQVLSRHSDFKCAVQATKESFIKKYSRELVFDVALQPNICTQVYGNMSSPDPRAVLYASRSLPPDRSVVCHLGEIYLGNRSKGDINNAIILASQ